MSNGSARLAEQDLQDIQGNLAGFNKDHLRLLFVGFPEVASGQRFLAAMASEVNQAAQVSQFNSRFSARRRTGEDPLSEPADWVNVAVNFLGLTLVQASGAEAFPQEFQAGMRARAALNGDVDTSDPTNWVGPFAAGAPAVHAIVIIAGDLPDLLEDRTQKVRDLIATSGVTELAGAQDGKARPGQFSGHEHFGFKDGISQPYVPGLTSASRGGTAIAAGEFLIGHEDQDGNLSGRAIEQPTHPAAPGEPGYPGAAPTQFVPLPPWTKNGSFLVYRRLRQDVGGFHSFNAVTAPTVGLSPEHLEAKLVGRWASGASLEHVPGEPPGLEDWGTDPSITDPGVLDDDHINAFGYVEHDSDGHLTPRAAHIRKAYPRDQDPPGAEEANRHRILRRGIAYGPEFGLAEPPYSGSGPVPDDQDRGLLFLCYQSSIRRGFEFIQQSWVNGADFPRAGDGVDAIVSQNLAQPPFSLPPVTHLTIARWVTTTGGEYFFAPSISGLRILGGTP